MSHAGLWPSRPPTNHSKSRRGNGGLFSLVDGIGSKPAPDAPSGVHASGRAPLPGPTAARPASRERPPITPLRHASSTNSMYPESGAFVSGARVSSGVPGPRGARANTAPTQAPRRDEGLGDTAPPLPTAGLGRPPPSRDGARPPLAGRGARPASQQAQRPRGGTASRGTASRGSQQQDFHRGLVSALHDVLRQQRSGVFPTPPQSGTPTQEGVQQPSRPGTSSGAERPPSSHAAPPREPTPQDPAVEEAIRRRKNLWAQKQWSNIRRQERVDLEQRSRDAEAHRGSPALHQAFMMGGGQDVVGGHEGMLSAATVQLLRSVERKETMERRQLTLQWERCINALACDASVDASSLEGLASSERSSMDAAADAATLKAEGNAHYQERRFAQAHRCYSYAIEADPSNVVLLTNRAATSTMLLNYDACVRDCLQAVNVDGTSWKAYSRMARAYVMMKQLAVASRHYTTALTLIEPESPHAPGIKAERGQLTHLEAAYRELEGNNYAASLEHFSRAPNFVDEPPVRLARVTAVMHIDPTAARAELNKYVNGLEHPASVASEASVAQLVSHVIAHYCDALVHLARASVYCGHHYVNIAQSHVANCLSIRGDFSPALAMQRQLTALGELMAAAVECMDAQDYSGAREAYSDAIATDANNAKLKCMLLLGRADAAMQLGDCRDAVADCTLVLQHDGNNLKALVKRSAAHEALGDARRAVADLEYAATINSDLVEDVVALKTRLLQHGRDASSSGFFESGTHSARGSRPTTAANSAPARTHYDILGVRADCDSNALRSQYRKLTLQYHPDKVVKETAEVRKQCELRFKEIAHAYSVLSDTAARVQYDMSLRG